jgi:hypothetical protein
MVIRHVPPLGAPSTRMNAKAPLNILGPMGNHEQVHPDVISVPQGFAGFHYWLVFTPYPSFNDRLENPTIRASQDAINWVRIPSVPDPLVPPPHESLLHHADPELLYFAGRLNVVYLTIDDKSGGVTFNMMSSDEDMHWSNPIVFRDDKGVVSPTFASQSGIVHQWFVRIGAGDTTVSEVFHQCGPDLLSLGPETKCELKIPDHVIWHIDVGKFGDKTEALVTAFPEGSDNENTRLFHASSDDGIVFKMTSATPLIEPTRFGWDNKAVYRSTFLKDQDGWYKLWYSGCSWGRHWGIGLLQGKLDSLDDPGMNSAHISSYVSRLPGEMSGWARYQIRRHFFPLRNR